jgi:hypothetical protein
LLYWSIGQDILNRQQAEGWGTKVIDRLAKNLGAEFPGVEGFSPRNRKRHLIDTLGIALKQRTGNNNDSLIYG